MGAYYVRFEQMEGGQTGLADLFLKLSLVLVLMNIFFFYRNGLYRSMRFSSRYKEIFVMLKANAISIIGFIIFLYFFGSDRLSRLTLIIYFTISSIGFVLVRLGVRNYLRILRKKGRHLKNVILVGNGKTLIEYIHNSRRFKDCGVRVIGWIDSDGKNKEFEISAITEPVSKIKDSIEFSSFILSYQSQDLPNQEKFLKDHFNDVKPIELLPDLGYSFVGNVLDDFADLPVISVNKPNFNLLEIYGKRWLDIILTLIGLIVISPLIIFIIIGIKLTSPGPIFYKQERVCEESQLFTMWKFRTMIPPKEGEDKNEWSNKENPRKTKLGDLLRKTSLDELPQLWNVLWGDMSLVGPRPERPFFVDKFKDEVPAYMLKHKMKPGITGWAQVNGWRGDTSIEKCIECDIYYIKNWSIWFDIKILFLTFFKGFINKNAY